MKTARDIPSHSHRSRAFTLVEMLTVVIVLGIVAATSIPAFTSVAEARKAAATAEVERLLITARARAMATSCPTGLEIPLAGDSVRTLEILSTGASPTVAKDLFGAPTSSTVIPAVYGGAKVSSLVNGDGTTSSRVIWFTHSATPQTRTTSGVLISAFTQDAVITMATGARLVVRRLTGAVEEQP